MKKILALLMSLLIVAFSFAACSNEKVKNETEDAEKISVICSVFPIYDWLSEMTASCENIELTLLLSNGVDLHNYQPSAEDIVKVSNCDMFIYVGGESDSWSENLFEAANNENMTKISLLSLLGENAKEEEHKEGMQENEDEHEHDEDEKELDEHVWLSLKNAKLFCKEISKMLCEKDSDNTQIYTQNTQKYLSSLEELDSEYEKAVSSFSKNTVVFADRFPFRYLFDDYSLSYYAAFSGCSAETEASFETISFLSEKVDELQLSCVMTIEKSDGKIASTVIENTQSKDGEILSMNSMQSVTDKEIENGASYLQIMKENLSSLTKALS